MPKPAARDQVSDNPCVLFALVHEAHPFLRDHRPHQRLHDTPCPVLFCGHAESRVLVVQTGMGRERIETALAWLGQRPLLDGVPYRPRLVISAGFAGALTASLRVGNLVLATEVWEESEGCVPVPWPGALLPGPFPARKFRTGIGPIPPLAPASGERGRGEGDSHDAEPQDFARHDGPPHPSPLPPSTGGEGVKREASGLETALAQRSTLQRGRIATAANPVADAQAKLDLGKTSGALSVDMESAWVARWCRQQGIAFGLLRAISDDAGTSFSPALQTLLQDGEPSLLRIAAAIARSPRLLSELRRLARDTHLAAEQLGQALRELLR